MSLENAGLHTCGWLVPPPPQFKYQRFAFGAESHASVTLLATNRLLLDWCGTVSWPSGYHLH